MDDSKPVTDSFHPRFSLLTILFVMALVACAITIVQLWREVAPLRAEVRRLRDEVRALSVEDPTKVQAIQVRKTDSLTWKWRLWMPAGHSYVLRLVGGKVPHTGFPKEGGTVYIQEPGEMWVEYRITKDAKSGEWRGSMYTKTGSVGSNLAEWVDWNRQISTGEGVGETTSISPADKNLTITRQYFSQTAPDSTQIEDPAPGFMIWLEPR